MAKRGPIRSRNGKRRNWRGFSLPELAIATGILLVGLLGGIQVIVLASANNSRSKTHTTAATLAQSTMERILAIPSSATGTAAETKVTDCTGNTYLIETAPGGAPLIGSGAFGNSIDFSQPAQASYSMSYAMCSQAGGTYDVRWRIDPGPTPSTQVVTVAVRTVGANGSPLFSLPYNLHRLRGNF